ncbi:NAD-dependent epimerase/dehydratase family protein [Candidatus Laterigemmans baculatus]|uniref:NAD-dependent epimerase/dehydratase family protein n=1 Tax=Candidatus Laterigemmans baculatus TaxID=2770505 RepID=UPI0013DCD67C|nr:NAD-dependent epimerase/dehydratase family protein [Candidatus Laterigemmans baculatus]
MRILVTGGTGLLGNNAVRQAIEAGHQVVALVRSRESAARCFEGLDVELATGDICDSEAVRRAAVRCDALIHSAGLIHIGWRRMQEAMEVNEVGSRNVAQVARQNGLRMVHVSTTNTLAIGQPHAPADETTPGDGQIASTYVLSKRAAEAAVEEEIAAGLEATIVHPGFMLGPWDWKPSSGRMLVEVARRPAPLAPRGGCSVCDARDVAQGLLAALERGQTGRHYVMAGENWTYFRLWREFAKIGGRRGPVCWIGPRFSWIPGGLSDLATRFSGREGDLNSAAMRTSQQMHWYRSDRAEAELGYRSRPALESIRDAATWFRDRGYLGM